MHKIISAEGWIGGAFGISQSQSGLTIDIFDADMYHRDTYRFDEFEQLIRELQTIAAQMKFRRIATEDPDLYTEGPGEYD